MRKKVDRGERESQLAAGWTVEADPTADPAPSVRDSAHDDGIDAPAPTHAEVGEAEAASAAGGNPEGTEQLSNAALVLMGVIGGLYLLYTWVWFSWANYYSQVNAAVAEGSGVIGAVLQQIVFWAAPLAPALWFVSAVATCRGARTGKLALWLLVGAVLLLPLPALITVGGAQ